MAVALGTPLLGDTCLTRATVPAQCSPRLGELMVAVGWVSGREEDHVIAIAKRHELQASKPDHRGQRKWTFGVSHPEKWWENDVWHATSPYLARQLSMFGPVSILSQRVNLCCVFPNLDGDAKRIHVGLFWFGRKKALRQAGGDIVFPYT
jgi:hypothetical protein